MMGPSLSRSNLHDDAWNEVWDSYDAQRFQPPPVRPLPMALALRHDGVRQRQGQGQVMLVLLTACCLLLLAATAFAAAPVQAAREVAQAFRMADLRAISAAVDWAALRRTGPRPPATPAATAADRFVASLAETVQERLATPDGLLGLVQARVGADWQAPVIDPIGLGTIRLTLVAAGQSGQGVALSLGLRGPLPPRWLVVAIEPLG